jgi:hypothetical protein
MWMRPASISGSWSELRVDGFSNSIIPDWDQQRFDIYSQDDCDFKLRSKKEARKFGAYPNGCLNLGNYIRAQAKANGLSLPMDAEFCVEQYFEAADKVQQKVTDSGIINEPLMFDHRLTIGCFTVRVNR